MTVPRLRRSRHPALRLIGLTALGLTMSLSAGYTQKAPSTHARITPPLSSRDDERYDPRAALLLKRMGDSYARVSALDLHIRISSTDFPLENGPDKPKVPRTPFQVDETKIRAQGRLHMAFRQSNQLLIETEQIDALTSKAYDQRWISDGQYFWTYTGQKKVYTKEKAPGSIHDFGRLQYLSGGTLELMMLIGPNPFNEILQNVDGARWLGETSLGSIPTEVVSLQMEDPIEQSEMRLYIGKDDGFLHRMEIESRPIIPQDGPIKVGSKLDAFLDANKPPPIKADPVDPEVPGLPPLEPPKPIKRTGSFLRFENDMDLRPNFPPGTFAFAPPKDGLLMGGQAAAPVKHLTPKQQLEQMAKNIRKKRAAMQQSAEKDN